MWIMVNVIIITVGSKTVAFVIVLGVGGEALSRWFRQSYSASYMDSFVNVMHITYATVCIRILVKQCNHCAVVIMLLCNVILLH